MSRLRETHEQVLLMQNHHMPQPLAYFSPPLLLNGFYWWLNGKESTCQSTWRLRFDPLEKEMAIRSNILAWDFPEEPDRLSSMELQRVRHNLVTEQQHCIRAKSGPVWMDSSLIISTKTLFLNKITFWDSGWTWIGVMLFNPVQNSAEIVSWAENVS